MALGAAVDCHMSVECLLTDQSFTALGAWKQLSVVMMNIHVIPQMIGESKRLITDGAAVGAFPCVQKHVGGITLLRR